MNSTQGFHAIMNLFLIPLWFLSGALFPVNGAWTGLQWVMRLNPLTYGLAALRRAMYWQESAAVSSLPSMATCLLVSVLFAVAMFAIASMIASGQRRADLQ
jgi:ABC-2 type transport system permease protein